MSTPYAPQAAHPAKVEPQEAEACKPGFFLPVRVHLPLSPNRLLPLRFPRPLLFPPAVMSHALRWSRAKIHRPLRATFSRLRTIRCHQSPLSHLPDLPIHSGSATPEMRAHSDNSAS